MKDEKRYPSAIGAILGEILAKRGLTERLDQAGAVERWPEVVGERVAANARAEAVTADGYIWVRVKSSPWAAELSLMAPRILARLNEGREGQIRGIRWLVGPTGEPPRPD